MKKRQNDKLKPPSRPSRFRSGAPEMVFGALTYLEEEDNNDDDTDINYHYNHHHNSKMKKRQNDKLKPPSRPSRF
jgi:hypothetical protein